MSITEYEFVHLAIAEEVRRNRELELRRRALERAEETPAPVRESFLHRLTHRTHTVSTAR